MKVKDIYGTLKNLGRIFFASFLFFLMFVFVFASAYAQNKLDKTTKSVLILQSYHQGFSWTDNIMSGIQKQFESCPEKVHMRMAYMDTKWWEPELAFPLLAQEYESRFKGYKIDVIIAADNNALQFVLENRQRLFADIPVVFCGINNFSDSMISGQSNVTGVVEDLDIVGTLEVMREVHPKLKKIILINDRTLTGNANRELFLQAFKPHQEEISLVDYTDMSFAEISQKIGELSDDSAIVLLTFHRDRTGRTFTLEEYATRISNKASVPTYALWEHYLGLGILGGVMVNGEEQGKTAAQMALKILGGVAADDIPVMRKSPNVSMFDFEQLKRYNLSINDFPENVYFLNRPHSFYETYKFYVWSVSGVIVFLFIIIGILLLNILRRKRAEKDLIESQARIRALFDQTFQFIGLMTVDGILIEANRTALEFAGIDESDVLGKPFWETVWWTHSQDLQEKVKNAVVKAAAGETVRFEAYHPDLEGNIRYVEFSVKPARDKTNKVIFLIPEGFDITERKKTEEELRKYREHLEELVEERTLELRAAQEKLLRTERLAVIGELAGSMAHELRTPLGGLKNVGYFIRKSISESAGKTVTTQLDILERGIDAMDRIITDVLSFGRMKEPQRKDVDINYVIKNSIGKCNIPENVEVKEELADKLPYLKIDEFQMIQVFSNIVLNALQSMPEGGTLIVKSSIEGNYVNIEVIDTGVGIAKENLSKVFDPLFSSKVTGIGLGLSICKNILSMHKAIINMESEEGKGTTVLIKVPIDKDGENG